LGDESRIFRKHFKISPKMQIFLRKFFGGIWHPRTSLAPGIQEPLHATVLMTLPHYTYLFIYFGYPSMSITNHPHAVSNPESVTWNYERRRTLMDHRCCQLGSDSYLTREQTIVSCSCMRDVYRWEVSLAWRPVTWQPHTQGVACSWCEFRGSAVEEIDES